MDTVSGRVPLAPGSQASPSAADASSPVGADPSREQWSGSKKQRATLRNKFGGRCAYCGDQLSDRMHADHLEPVVRVTRDCMGKPMPASECYMVKPERNTVGNMMPACAPCNLHKGGYPLEAWRDIIQRSAAICRRDTSTFKVGERFGIIDVHERPVVFHFEKCQTCENGEYFPQYGVAPHECFWRKGPQFTIGQSTLLPIKPEHCFVPDIEDGQGWDSFEYPHACGVYYCPDCGAEAYRRAWARLVSRIGPPPCDSDRSPEGGDAKQAPSSDESAGPQGHRPEVSA